MSALVLVAFSVPFVRGQARPRFGRGRTYKVGRDRECEKRIAVAYKGAALRKYGHIPQAPKGVPVTLVVTCERELPRSRPKRVRREPDVVKPDASNEAKLVEDALNGVAWADDSQVTELHAFKRDRLRGQGERTLVTVLWDEREGLDE